MSTLQITEADTVQFPMVRHASEIGWTPVPPQEALAHRGGPAGLLFRGELEEAPAPLQFLADRRRHPRGSLSGWNRYHRPSKAIGIC